MEQEKLSSRRDYSAQFLPVFEQCASVAKVALSLGTNANVVHRLRREARDNAGSVSPGCVRRFALKSVSAPTHSTHQDCADIRIELRRGITTMAITWPGR